MRSFTPFFSITESSSFCTSSKVKPYWKPEQPPPVTKTRSLSSGLPSSSISCLTLLAALSEKFSGAGIWVGAFIVLYPWSARRLLGDFELDAFHFCGVMHEAPFDHSALLHLDALVMHVSFDPGIRLHLRGFAGIRGPVDRAVDDDVRGLDLAVDAGMLGDHERARLLRERRHVAAHGAIDPKTAGEEHVALDARSSADQAVDPVL